MIFCSMNSLEPKLQSENLFDTNKTGQKIFDGFNMKNLVQKFHIGRMFYLSYTFETLKKSL